MLALHLLHGHHLIGGKPHLQVCRSEFAIAAASITGARLELMLMTLSCLLQLLRLLGLKKDLNQAAFRACAEQVETWELADMEPEQKAEALATARQLVHELASSPSLQGTSLYHAVRDIAFVPASLVRTLPTSHCCRHRSSVICRGLSHCNAQWTCEGSSICQKEKFNTIGSQTTGSQKARLLLTFLRPGGPVKASTTVITEAAALSTSQSALHEKVFMGHACEARSIS